MDPEAITDWPPTQVGIEAALPLQKDFLVAKLVRTTDADGKFWGKTGEKEICK